MNRKLGIALSISFAAIGPTFAVGTSGPDSLSWRHILLYTWKNNALTVGEDIRIYRDGQYESHPWCDICRPRMIKGQWQQVGNVFTLAANGPQDRTRRMQVVERSGCHFLYPSEGLKDDEVINPLMAYTRDDERCDISPTGVVRKLSPKG